MILSEGEIFVVFIYLSRMLDKLIWTLDIVLIIAYFLGLDLVCWIIYTLVDWKGKFAVKVNWATVSKGDWLRTGPSPQSSHYLRGLKHKQTVDLFPSWYRSSTYQWIRWTDTLLFLTVLVYYESQTRRNLLCNCMENMFFSKDPFKKKIIPLLDILIVRD